MSEDMEARQAGSEARPPLVRYQMMATLMSDTPLPAEEFASILAQHAEFLASGGGGGQWSTFVTSGGADTGIVLGVYQAPSGERRGAQASLSHKRLDGADLRGAQLSYADLVGVTCRDQNLDGADLQGSLMVDGDFSGSSFHRANLRRVDLSRSDLVGCDLREADLRNADLENVDLSNSDLTGAKVAGAKLAGARMDGVRGLNEPAPKPPRPSAQAGAEVVRRQGPAGRGSHGQAGTGPAGDHGRRPE
ncbi:MAG: pentapeptide repeat-containing protein [Anaerolineae bacterium]